jgi:hypothetical protein
MSQAAPIVSRSKRERRARKDARAAAELYEFLQTDASESEANPAFKERLREECWQIVEAQSERRRR